MVNSVHFVLVVAQYHRMGCSKVSRLQEVVTTVNNDFVIGQEKPMSAGEQRFGMRVFHQKRKVQEKYD